MIDRNLVIEAFFNDLLNNNIIYLIPRKADLVYNSNIKDDIDVIVRSSDFCRFKEIAKKLGFDMRKDYPFFHIYLYGSGPHYHFINYEKDIHIDVTKKWQHKSINYDMCGSRVVKKWLPVHEKLQKKMWDSIRPHDGMKWAMISSKEIELTHIMCHVLLDKDSVSSYYKERIYQLINCVNIELLLEYLSLVFYNFAQKYIDLCKSSSFDRIHVEYLSFKGY